jgi:hypothetical protein
MNISMSDQDATNGTEKRIIQFPGDGKGKID